jgi:hypothetical protein
MNTFCLQCWLYQLYGDIQSHELFKIVVVPVCSNVRLIPGASVRQTQSLLSFQTNGKIGDIRDLYACINEFQMRFLPKITMETNL